MPKPTPDAEPTLISCPGCAGVVSIIKEPDGAHVRFACTVGHTYTLPTLLQAKEEDVERALWSVAAYFEHIKMINALFLRQIDALQLSIDKQGLERRTRQAEQHGERIRQMIDESDVSDLEPRMADDMAS